MLNAGAPDEQLLGAKIAGVQLEEGDTVTIVTPGAGGYGVPAERDRSLVERDLREEKVSLSEISQRDPRRVPLPPDCTGPRESPRTRPRGVG